MQDALDVLEAAVTALAQVDVHLLSEGAALEHTEGVLDGQNRLAGIGAHALQACDVRDVTVSLCGRQTRSWLVEEQHLSRAEAGRRMFLARRLPAHPEIAVALVAGEINHEHAQRIISCLATCKVEDRAAVEAELVSLAREFDPGLLAEAVQGIRVRTGADEDAEAAAQKKYDDRWVTLSSTFDGMTAVTGMLDPESAATIRAALTPLLTKTGAEDERSAGQRCVDGLVNLARFSLTHGDLPDHGGERPQVIVTIPYNELRDGLQAGELGHGTLNGLPITPATARRYACHANIIPAVMGADSEVLDLGRSRRIFTRAQRRAAALRDGGCVFPSCQTALARCELHHLDHFEHGGPTDHRNSAYLCMFHHWLIHHTNWTITRNPDGKIVIQRT